MAMAMGWELDEIRQDIAPVVAERKLQTSYFSIGEGEVAGLHQEAIGTGENAMIRLELEMSVEPDQPGDSVHLSGEPPIDLVIRGGVNGDTATVGRVVNHIPAVMVAPPGLATVLDIPISNGGSPVPAPKLTGRGRLL
jgi:4-hydroxy-tetrahydrodipicolinate reductase